MSSSSPRKVDANRRNARKSTGPKTDDGKRRSRLNALKHGFSASVVVPDRDQAEYEARLARWEREAGPSNVVEEHLIRRAAVGSIICDRLDESRESTRQESAREAVRRWEEKQRHRARRKAQDLVKDPANVVPDLEATAFGCDWLIRKWQSLDAPLSLGKPWDHRLIGTAQLLLGYPEGTPGVDADPVVRLLWLLAGACSPQRIAALPRLDDELELPTDPIEARQGLRDFIADQVDRLDRLRQEAWEAIEGPNRDAVASRALAADPSPEGDRHHRYLRDADRSASSAIRLYLNLRDRRHKERLDIAREAGRIDLPRVPAGNGWWHEVDAGPAPPGFTRIGSNPPAEPTSNPTASPIPTPTPTPTPTSPIVEPSSPRLDSSAAPRPTSRAPGSEPVPSPTPEPIGPRPVSPAPDAIASNGAPQRNEPKNAPGSDRDIDRKPHQKNTLRNDPPSPSPGAPGRTGPLPGPDHPAPDFSPSPRHAIIPDAPIDPLDRRRAS